MLFVWTVVDPAFGSAHTTALLFTLGLATAIGHALSMRRGFAFACIGLLCLPGLVVMLWHHGVGRANGLMMLVYLAYVVISLPVSYTHLDVYKRQRQDFLRRR